MKKVIITAPVHEYLPLQLAKIGYDVAYHPAISYEELSLLVGDAYGLVVTTRIKIDKALLDAAHALICIGRLGCGLVLIDDIYAQLKGLILISTHEGYRNAVAEHAIGLLLKVKELHTGPTCTEYSFNVNVYGTVGLN